MADSDPQFFFGSFHVSITEGFQVGRSVSVCITVYKCCLRNVCVWYETPMHPSEHPVRRNAQMNLGLRRFSCRLRCPSSHHSLQFLISMTLLPRDVASTEDFWFFKTPRSQVLVVFVNSCLMLCAWDPKDIDTIVDMNGRLCHLCAMPFPERSDRTYVQRTDCGNQSLFEHPENQKKPIIEFNSPGSTAYCELNYNKACADGIYNKDGQIFWSNNSWEQSMLGVGRV